MNNRDSDLEKTIDIYGNLIFKTCFIMLRNKHDAEDVAQETFYKYMISDRAFATEEHKKAWLLRVSQNKCKDMLRFKKVHSYISYEDVEENFVVQQDVEAGDIEDILRVSNLSYDYKSVVMLYYFEGYSINEVADILNISSTAVRKRLQRAREKLKIVYEKINEEGAEPYESR